jgi:hypothetical protein
MPNYRVMPGRRHGDGWLLVIQPPAQPMSVVCSFDTWDEAQRELRRLSEDEDAAMRGAPRYLQHTKARAADQG